MKHAKISNSSSNEGMGGSRGEGETNIVDNVDNLIIQRIFSAAPRRDPQEGKTDSVRRGGVLKMDWTEPRGV